MFGRRILILVAVVMGLTALAASLAPTPQSVRRPGATAGPAPAAPQEPGAGRTVTARLSADRPEPGREIRVTEGDTVAIEVTGDVVDAVVIEDLAVTEAIDPDSPARVELLADTPGRFAIRLLERGDRLGTLRIAAAG